MSKKIINKEFFFIKLQSEIFSITIKTYRELDSSSLHPFVSNFYTLSQINNLKLLSFSTLNK